MPHNYVQKTKQTKKKKNRIGLKAVMSYVCSNAQKYLCGLFSTHFFDNDRTSKLMFSFYGISCH